MDIVVTANLLLKKYGKNVAAMVAIAHIRDLCETGDLKEAAVWGQVWDTVEDMLHAAQTMESL